MLFSECVGQPAILAERYEEIYLFPIYLAAP